MLTRSSIALILILSNHFLCFLAEASRKDLRNKEAKLINVQQLNRPKAKLIDPSRVTELYWKPRVFLYEKFLSDEESDHLISLVQKGNTSTNKVGNVSLSSNFVFPFDAEFWILESTFTRSIVDGILARIEEKISAWTFIPKDNGMPLQVLHFGYEESVGSYNYFDNRSTVSHVDTLMATVVLYLSNVSIGGQLLFPESDTKILSDCRKSSNALRPTKGNAVVIFNVHVDATLDKSSSHGRCPVPKGEMWCAVKDLHLRPLIKEKEPLPSGIVVDNGCTDEDDNCPQWAAIGECKRNPVFMIGSPDYYGTCRRSCNACSLVG